MIRTCDVLPRQRPRRNGANAGSHLAAEALGVRQEYRAKIKKMTEENNACRFLDYDAWPEDTGDVRSILRNAPSHI